MSCHHWLGELVVVLVMVHTGQGYWSAALCRDAQLRIEGGNVTVERSTGVIAASVRNGSDYSL